MKKFLLYMFIGTFVSALVAVAILLSFIIRDEIKSKASQTVDKKITIREQLASKAGKVIELEKALAEAKQKNSEVTQENSGLRAELSNLKKETKASQEKYGKLQTKLAALQKKNKNNVKSLDKLNEDYRSARAEISFIKSLIDQLVLNSLAKQGIKLGEIYFKTGSSKFFTNPARAKKTIAKILGQIDPKLHRVVIVGECDKKRWRTNDELNEAKLSTNRALTILKILGLKISFTSYVSGKGKVNDKKKVAVYIVPKNAVNTLDALIDLKKEIE